MTPSESEAKQQASTSRSRQVTSQAKQAGSEVSRALRQLQLLLWKNLKLQMRSPVGTLIELLVPALFAIILLPIRRIVKSDQYVNDTMYEAFTIERLPYDLIPVDPNYKASDNWLLEWLGVQSDGTWTLAYQPDDSPLLDTLMSEVSRKLRLGVKSFANESAMLAYLLDPTDAWRRLGGVSFTSYTNLSQFAYELRYSSSPRNSHQNGYSIDAQVSRIFFFSSRSVRSY